MTTERSHHQRNVARRRANRAIHLPEPPLRHPRTLTRRKADLTTSGPPERTGAAVSNPGPPDPDPSRMGMADGRAWQIWPAGAGARPRPAWPWSSTPTTTHQGKSISLFLAACRRPDLPRRSPGGSSADPDPGRHEPRSASTTPPPRRPDPIRRRRRPRSPPPSPPPAEDLRGRLTPHQPGRARVQRQARN
jgi:hypothetical protein